MVIFLIVFLIEKLSEIWAEFMSILGQFWSILEMGGSGPRKHLQKNRKFRKNGGPNSSIYFWFGVFNIYFWGYSRVFRLIFGQNWLKNGRFLGGDTVKVTFLPWEFGRFSGVLQFFPLHIGFLVVLEVGRFGRFWTILDQFRGLEEETTWNRGGSLFGVIFVTFLIGFWTIFWSFIATFLEDFFDGFLEIFW